MLTSGIRRVDSGRRPRVAILLPEIARCPMKRFWSYAYAAVVGTVVLVWMAMWASGVR
jgi:hypothetical protein